MRPTRAEIDLGAFVHNIAVARRYAGSAELIAVLKADAYGHGLERMCVEAMATGLIDKIALTSVEEAERVRRQGVECPIVLLEGIFEDREIPWCIDNNIELVFHSDYQFDHVMSYLDSVQNLERPMSIWLKVNSGMNRLGFELDDARHWISAARERDDIALKGIMMHFACADEPGSASSNAQLCHFNSFVDQEDNFGLKSLSNSAALMGLPEAVQGAVRPGIMLYGASPLMGKAAEELGLKPVMRLTSKVIAVRDITLNAEVGYGASWTASTSTRLAVVAIGYADGYPRHASNLASVAISGVCYPVVGRVSMDMITVDISGSAVEIGDTVELWGGDMPVEMVSELCGTISYELLTGITSRVPRYYISAE